VRRTSKDFFERPGERNLAKNRAKLSHQNLAKKSAFFDPNVLEHFPANSFTAIHLSLSTGAKNCLSVGTGFSEAYRMLADSPRATHPVTIFGTCPCYAA